MSRNPFLSVKDPLRLYAVVSTAEWVARLVDAGVSTVLLRNKQLFGSALYNEIQCSVKYAEQSSTQLFINDFWWEAVDCGAYGVHLGSDDVESADLVMIQSAGLRLGISTYTDEQFYKALAVYPSYILCGAASGHQTIKADIHRLKKYVSLAGNIPLVVSNGTCLDDVKDALTMGVSSIAVGQSLFETDGLEQTLSAYQNLWNH